MTTMTMSMSLGSGVIVMKSGEGMQRRGGRSTAQGPAAAVAKAVLNEQKKTSLRSKRPQNVPGQFFVDHTCIDCDTCRWMAPKHFNRVGEMSAVYNQPTTPEDRLVALQALLACPTASIHAEASASEILAAQDTYPLAIDEETLPGVYDCGYHSPKSYGATSYLIVRPEGNILIDSPKFNNKLARRIEDLGGVRYMFLSHKDDVADHDQWHKRFQCSRILHESDVRPDTADVETKLQGSGPWILDHDVDLIFTPGHTEGCVCLFYKPKRVLFTGDHLAKGPDGPLKITRRYNQYSVEKQIESLKILLPLDFTWILPGHGRRMSFSSIEEKNQAIEELASKETAISLVYENN